MDVDRYIAGIRRGLKRRCGCLFKMKGSKIEKRLPIFFFLGWGVALRVITNLIR